MNRIEQMRALLAALQPESLDIADDSHLHAGHASAGSGGHYRLYIVSAQFTGKATLARHRMIYSALGKMMHQEIHALNIIAQAPNEITLQP